jgi:two-component system OmpR family response regulator
MQPEAARRHILVVEDDPLLRELVETRLQTAGYRTAGARSGWEALELATAVRPSAIILDIAMPGLDGYGVLQEIRARKDLKSIPVMMLTARNGPEDVRRAVKLGAQDFISKPFSDARLLQRVARLLHQRPSAGPPPAAPPQAVVEI